MEQLSIGELAARVGIPTTTVRYYERSGLLRKPARSASNYRVYDHDAVERLRFIRAAQSAGLTLADIGVLLRYRDGLVAPCREVKLLIEKRLEKIQSTLREFRHVQHVLKSYLEICRQAEEDEPCGVLDRLDDTSSGEPEGNGRRGP